MTRCISVDPDMILFWLEMSRYDSIAAQHFPDRTLDIRCHGVGVANCRVIIEHEMKVYPVAITEVAMAHLMPGDFEILH